MKIYCSHDWVPSMKLITEYQCSGIGTDTGSMSAQSKNIPMQVCNRCHTEWLKGDSQPPEVEIGYTKE